VTADYAVASLGARVSIALFALDAVPVVLIVAWVLSKTVRAVVRTLGFRPFVIFPVVQYPFGASGAEDVAPTRQLVWFWRRS
jgi:hypothetical protein